MAAKTSWSFASCFTFLKEALILPTLLPKLFTPVSLLISFNIFLVLATNVFFSQPLTMDMVQLASKMQNTDPSSAEYARIMEEIKQDARQLILITIAFAFVTVILGFFTQLVAFFAATTTCSGDRYSLPELLMNAMKGNLKGPFITIALVTILEVTSMALLAVLLSSMMKQNSKLISIQVLLAFLAFLYFNIVGLVSIAVSVANTDCRGMCALRQAWWLMTRVRRKEGLVLVVVAHLLPMVLGPLYLVALAYTKKSMALGLCLMAMYALLSGAVQLFIFVAATVYYFEATNSKDVMAYAYTKIPTGEPNC
ncbi:hypothetical protein ABZP36_035937 [Zizania latifolia]